MKTLFINPQFSFIHIFPWIEGFFHLNIFIFLKCILLVWLHKKKSICKINKNYVCWMFRQIIMLDCFRDFICCVYMRCLVCECCRSLHFGSWFSAHSACDVSCWIIERKINLKWKHNNIMWDINWKSKTPHILHALKLG